MAVETLRRQDPAKGFVDRESLENTTNLKDHLKKHHIHVVQYQEVVQAEEDSAKKRKEL